MCGHRIHLQQQSTTGSQPRRRASPRLVLDPIPSFPPCVPASQMARRRTRRWRTTSRTTGRSCGARSSRTATQATPRGACAARTLRCAALLVLCVAGGWILIVFFRWARSGCGLHRLTHTRKHPANTNGTTQVRLRDVPQGRGRGEGPGRPQRLGARRPVSQSVTPVLQYLFCSLRLCFYT